MSLREDRLRFQVGKGGIQLVRSAAVLLRNKQPGSLRDEQTFISYSDSSSCSGSAPAERQFRAVS